MRHWADGGDTNLENLVPLCRHHHRLVHEGGVRVERLESGDFRFRRGDADAIERLNAEAGLGNCARTIVTRWRGERMDHAWAVEVLQQRDDHPHPSG